MELDDIYKEKAKGAFIRSRLKWFEEGERNSKYFFDIEKRNMERSSLHKIKVENSTTEDYTVILFQKMYFIFMLIFTKWIYAQIPLMFSTP